jgi:hypothetical protein
MGPALVAKLSSAAAVTALVGNRISPQVNTAGKFPQVVYEISKQLVPAINSADELKKYMITLTVAALSYADADELAGKVKAALHEQTDGWGDAFVRSSLIQDEQQDEEHDPEDPTRIYHTITQTYQVWAFTGD